MVSKGKGGWVPVEGVQHLDHDEGGKGHGWGVVVGKDVAIDAFESLVLNQALRLVRLRTPTQ